MPEQLSPCVATLSQCCRTHDPQLLSPCTATAEALMPRQAPTTKATAMSSSHTTMQSSLHSLKLESLRVTRKTDLAKNKSVNFKRCRKHLKKGKNLTSIGKFLLLYYVVVFSTKFILQNCILKNTNQSRLLSILEFEIQPSLGHIWNSNIY